MDMTFHLRAYSRTTDALVEQKRLRLQPEAVRTLLGLPEESDLVGNFRVSAQIAKRLRELGLEVNLRAGLVYFVESQATKSRASARPAPVPGDEPVRAFPLGESLSAGDEAESDAEVDDDADTSEPVPTEAELKARAELKAVLLPLLKDALRIKVETGHFTSPNDRTIKVFLDDECLAECTFDIKARREYEG